MKNVLYLAVILGFFYSCVPHKRLVYFQKNQEHNDDTISIVKLKYKIQSGDKLSVNVTSYNAQVTDFYNLKSVGKDEGYLVNQYGYIHMRMLDSIYVRGLSIVEIQEIIKSKISEQVAQPYVIVNLSNFRFVALGEVGAKGIHEVGGNEITIFEALAFAGDITDFGNKENVKLIRKIGDKEVFITMNLNNREIIKSEYFYIQPNDVIYVEPLKAKSFRTNVSQVTLVMSIASFIFIFYNYIKLVQK